MKRIALVVGATGGIGSETARALVARGWTVRALNRNVEQAKQRAPVLGAVEWVQGDAMNPSEVVAAAAGASVVVHAVNPPGYKNWKGLALPMLESTIAAAKAAGARIVFPGTVYNYGPDAFPLLGESSPQNPETRKGKIRVLMEGRLREAAEAGTPVLIVRAGDFFGPNATSNNWFSHGLVKPGRPLRSVTYPGEPEAGHAWAYLPDLAQTFAELLERAFDLRPFELFHFGGHWFERGIAIAEATRTAAGVPRAPIRRLPWFGVRLLSPFVETFHEMLEMRYLWRTPVQLDNSKLAAFLGREPHTPLETALRDTLEGLGCLDGRHQQPLGEVTHAA
jgi:nucleoside-diphosphate-sugar epimerase